MDEESKEWKEEEIKSLRISETSRQLAQSSPQQHKYLNERDAPHHVEAPAEVI